MRAAFLAAWRRHEVQRWLHLSAERGGGEARYISCLPVAIVASAARSSMALAASAHMKPGEIARHGARHP